MKRILFLALTFFIFLGCSKDKEENPITLLVQSPSFLSELQLEYNISVQDLVLEGVSNGIDTSLIFFNGRLNQKLWIGCYEKETKVQLFEWTDNSILDTAFYLNLGYGEYSNMEVTYFNIKTPYYKNDIFCFILWGVVNNYLIGAVNSDLYFVINNELIMKRRSFIYPDRSFYQEIIPWYHSIFLKLETNSYACFSLNGDSLFTSNINNFSLEKFEPINIEECIEMNTSFYNDSTANFTYKRRNLKTSEIFWENNIISSKNITNTDRLDSMNVEKNDSLWSYLFFYTTLEGEKNLFNLDLNILTGALSFED